MNKIKKALKSLKRFNIDDLLEQYFDLTEYERKTFIFLFNDINYNSYFKEIDQIIDVEIKKVLSEYKLNPNKEELKKIVRSFQFYISKEEISFYKEMKKTSGKYKIGDRVEFVIISTQKENNELTIDTKKCIGTIESVGLSPLGDVKYLIKFGNKFYSRLESVII